MDKTQLQEIAEKAFSNLSEWRKALFIAAEKTVECERAYEADKAKAMTSGKIDGKNEETRRAQLRVETAASFAIMEAATAKEREARYLFDTAQIEVDTVKTFLRIAEL